MHPQMHRIRNGYYALPFIIINESLIFEVRDRAAGHMREPLSQDAFDACL